MTWAPTMDDGGGAKEAQPDWDNRGREVDVWRGGKRWGTATRGA
jgi:hypothetical protein